MKNRTIILILSLAALLVALLFLFEYFNEKNVECSKYQIDKCPPECVICPPCIYCSSISCQTEEFCESIGFNRSWWEMVRPR